MRTTWSGTRAIVTIPERFDHVAARLVSAEMLSVISRGARLLIVDMSATSRCERAGTDTLTGGYWLAALAGTEMRLVAPGTEVRGALSVSGLDNMARVRPSLASALGDQSSVNGTPGDHPAIRSDRVTKG
jgi:anti-anti-sigma regulatory factor